MRGETKRRVAMSLLASPSLNQSHDVALGGVSDAQLVLGRLRSPRPRCA